MLWLLFGLTHSILAAFGVKRRLENTLGGAQVYRLTYSILALLIFGGIVYYVFTASKTYLFEPSIITQYVSYALIILGLGLMALSLKSYKPLEFFGVKPMTPLAEKLVTDGFNGIVRHPLYLSTNIFMIGLLINLPTQAMLLNLLLYFTYLFIGVYFEEKKLVEKFGEEYRQYQRKVKAFVPFIV